MKLLTKAIKERLPKLYETEKVPLGDKVLVCKFFTPDAGWTWYATEYNPDEKMFFGLTCGHCNEWGYFSLLELEQLRGKLGLPVERDFSFEPTLFKNLKDA
jgi:hypothetical protein